MPLLDNLTHQKKQKQERLAHLESLFLTKAQARAPSSDPSKLKSRKTGKMAAPQKRPRKDAQTAAPPQPPKREKTVAPSLGVGRPRCKHSRITDIYYSSKSVGACTATCLDTCGSRIKQCPDCKIWDNYK